jgi:ATP-dependent DNA helicase RecQ
MDPYRQILQQYWHYDDFRGIQREIIESISSGKDTLGLMPTGGGKSITFQVPALAKEGTCIVITPLIALMKDQVQHLRAKGVKAAAIYSGMKRAEILKTLDNCIFGGVKLLYVSPERLASELFLTKLRHMKVSFITVDEAHCISQWGYDFRPAYLNIASIRKIKPEAPVLALTATATLAVIDDIQEKLAFKAKNVFRMSFERKNLAYVVRKAEDKPAELIHIIRHVPGSAIVYVRSRSRCKDIAEALNQEGITATFYHAGLEHATRDERQKEWQRDEKRVMVATNAFGMGIDKPDVRTVIHFDCPDSIEAYFQEAGRAGRDGKKAYAVLLWNGNDIGKLNRRVDENFPAKDYINNVYQSLAFYYEIGVGSGSGHTFAFDIGKFCATYHFFPIPVDAALHLLENAGYLHYETDPDSAARVHVLLTRNELYKLDELSQEEEAVMTALLRCYGGLFTDYQYIDEALVAAQAKGSPNECYHLLKALSKRSIINFIPQRKTPYITYLRDREDTVFLPKNVYEERKEQYINRISAFITYATNDTICRSRQLLAYFGEERSEDCGHCDVCIDARHHAPTADDDAVKKILQLLSDKGVHTLKEVYQMDAGTTALDRALRFLISEEKVKADADKLTIA